MNKRGTMKAGIIIEIAVVNACATAINPAFPHDTGADHYWRVRWMDDGEQVDASCCSESLAEMTRQVRGQVFRGELVAWRYYETGI